ncbi:MAG: hypothetical protein WBD00_02575 [Candidatus Omnitrophota bacterium]
MSKYFAVLDVGSNEISAVAARWIRNGDYVIEGFCRVPSKGFRRGLVSDQSLATDSVAGALNKLKEKTGRKIRDVYAGVSSTSVGLIKSSGAVLLSKYGREITENDVKKCVKIAATVKTPLDKEPLHRIVRGFSIDGDGEIANPLNLEGVKLEADVNILMINSSVLRNMSKCISQAGFLSEGFVFSGLASSYRVLNNDDRGVNVAVLDISRDLTEAMVFFKGRMIGCKVLSAGAGSLLTESGNIDPEGLEGLSSRVSSLRGWRDVRKMLVTGEGALEHEMIESLEKIFTFPVKAGTCIAKPFEDLPPDRAGYIGSLGILDYLQEEKNGQKLAGNLLSKIYYRILSFIDRYF